MTIRQIYRQLSKRYGEQHWWPADTPFEVMVGAVLTQNTAWTNVEKAIANLKAARLLNPAKIVKTSPPKLAEQLRPSGYFNIKARRLQNFCRWYVGHGEFEKLCLWSTHDLRKALLSVNGVGPETADDILLYAFDRPVFVIDAYTRRLFSRLGFVKGDESYEALRLLIEDEFKINPIKKRVAIFNNYHALIVQHAKDVCKKNRPLCDDCHLSSTCGANRLEELI